MALLLHLKYVESLRGRGDRLAKVVFRGERLPFDKSLVRRIPTNRGGVLIRLMFMNRDLSGGRTSRRTIRMSGQRLLPFLLTARSEVCTDR